MVGAKFIFVVINLKFVERSLHHFRFKTEVSSVSPSRNKDEVAFSGLMHKCINHTKFGQFFYVKIH